MQQRTTKVNASEETIQIGPIRIRFLLTGDDSLCCRHSSRITCAMGMFQRLSEAYGA